MKNGNLIEKIIVPLLLGYLAYSTVSSSNEIANVANQISVYNNNLAFRQLKLQEKQLKHSRQSKYLELFYGGMNSKDQHQQKMSIELLKILEPESEIALRNWLLSNSLINDEIKSLAREDEFVVNFFLDGSDRNIITKLNKFFESEGLATKGAPGGIGGPKEPNCAFPFVVYYYDNDSIHKAKVLHYFVKKFLQLEINIDDPWKYVQIKKWDGDDNWWTPNKLYLSVAWAYMSIVN